MSTGDIKNNLRILRKQLQLIKYQESIDYESLSKGITSSFLPILHYLVSDFSCELSLYFAGKDYDFYGKNDLRFIEILYKLLMKEFSMKPMLTKQQFFANGFAEKKVIFVTKIIESFRIKANDLITKMKKIDTKISKSKIKDLKLNKKGNITKNQTSQNSIELSDQRKNIHSKTSNTASQSTDWKNSKANDVIDLTQSKNNIATTNFKKSALNGGLNLDKDFSEKKSVSFHEPIDFVLNKSDDIVKSMKDFSSTLKPYFDDPFEISKRSNGLKTQQDPLELSIIENDFNENHNKFEKFKSPVISKENNFVTPDIYLIDDSLSPSHEPNQLNVSPKHVENYHLPKALVTKETAADKSCLKCKGYIEENIRTSKRLEKLENQLEKILAINNELQAKVTVLETRIDILETRNQKFVHKPSSRTTLNDVTNNLLNVSNSDKYERTLQKNSDVFSPRKDLYKKFSGSPKEILENSHNYKFKSESKLIDENMGFDKDFDETMRESFSKASPQHIVSKLPIDSEWNKSFDFMCESTKSTIAQLQKQIKETKLLFSNKEL